MKYRLVRNYFAPMVHEWGLQDDTPSHGVLVRACNFDCAFCNRTFIANDNYQEYSDDEFAMAVLNLLKDGVRFKFSGGEPTLDSTLEEKLSFVRQCGGKIFLDTNGSFPDRVESCLKKQLVDVLGISLKGTTPESACETARIKNSRICWDNPLSTIQLATLYPSIKFIVTYVFHDADSYDKLLSFAKLLPHYQNLYLKMNNLYYEKHRVPGLQSLESESFVKLADKFLEEHPEWRSKLILVENEKAISHFEAIRFL